MLLSDTWVKRLVELPETGMGYQIVNIHLNDGKIIENIIVSGSQEIIGRAVKEHGRIERRDLTEDFSEGDIVDITTSK